MSHMRMIDQVRFPKYVSLVQDASEASRGCTVRLLNSTYTFHRSPCFFSDVSDKPPRDTCLIYHKEWSDARILAFAPSDI